MSSEQWLSDGICNECRRKNYCHKPCKANIYRGVSITSSLTATIPIKLLKNEDYKETMSAAIDAMCAKGTDGRFMK